MGGGGWNGSYKKNETLRYGEGKRKKEKIEKKMYNI